MAPGGTCSGTTTCTGIPVTGLETTICRPGIKLGGTCTLIVMYPGGG